MSSYDTTEGDETADASWEDTDEPRVPESAVEGAEEIAEGESVSLEELLVDAERVTENG